MSRDRPPLPALYPVALVAFSGQTDLRWLRILKRGFRHVFVAVNDGTHWITVDPLSHRMEIAVQPVGADFDLAGHYRRNGLRVVAFVPPPVLPRPAPVALCTCVEAAKRVLGIHDPFIVTPWQLYRHVARRAPAPGDLLIEQRSNFSMIRFISWIGSAIVASCRWVADAWRALCRWAARLRARVTTALSTLFS